MNSKLQTRIIIQSVLIVVTCFVFIAALGHRQIQSVFLNNHISMLSSSYEQKYINALLHKDTIENTTNQFKNNNQLINLLGDDEYNFNVNHYLNRLPNLNLKIIGAFIITSNGHRYSSETLYNVPSYEQMYSKEEYRNFFDSKSESMWFLTRELMWDFRNMGRFPEVLIYADKIYDNDLYVGTIFLTVRTELILASYYSDKNTVNTFLYQAGQTIITSSSDSTTADTYYNDVDGFIRKKTSGGISRDGTLYISCQQVLNFHIVSYHSLSHFYNNMNLLKYSLLTTLLPLTVILVLLYRKLTNKIFKPLEKLNAQIKKYHK